jgi:hypothetical protein
VAPWHDLGHGKGDIRHLPSQGVRSTRLLGDSQGQEVLPLGSSGAIPDASTRARATATAQLSQGRRGRFRWNSIRSVLAGGAVAAERAASTSSAGPQRNYAPPYTLRGDRLFFTNWTYIAGGGFNWQDADGRVRLGVRLKLPLAW